ncbi:mevalonate kinase-like [Pogonomyrmex barbatus]|uniref:Mevalonate kinase-like n=1 Tax=Pogonomyrmex barbatus TaxID=144034 RepID=A0A6I9WSG6_9HYME|nr:mevalonate kinase-like [Pogonomyrmex barbatus]
MQNVNKGFHYTLINNINRFLGSLNINNGIYDLGNIKARHLSLRAFLYLFVFVTYKENIEMTATINVKISSDLEMGKGLGSSATFVTCLAACFFRWSLLQKGIVRKFNDDDFEKIVYYAWNCEKIIYNGQCKSNIYGSIHGEIMLEGKDSPLCKMDSVPPMHILLIDTNINQEKKTVQMEEMHHLCPCTDFIVISIESMFPQLFTILLAICGVYVNQRENNIERNIQFAELDDYYENLLSSINRNQSLLKALGLTNQNINLISAIAQKYLCGCKMTSTSGYVFILPLPTSTSQHMELKQELESYHFSVIQTYINCKGLAID